MKPPRLTASSDDSYFKTDAIRADLKKRAVRGAGATIFSQVTNQGIQITSTIILARLLTPDDFGLVTMVISIFLFFKMFRSGGLLDATIQKETITHEQISTLFWINLGFGASMTLLFICFAPAISWFYNEPRLKTIAVLISLDFILAGFSAQHRALLKRTFQFSRITAIEISGNITSVIIAIVLALRGWGYWALVVRHVAYPIVETIGAWTLCRWRPGLPAYGAEVRAMLKFGLSMLGNFSVNYFTDNLDKILIGWRYGTQSVGFYSRAFYLFMAPATQMAYPMTGVAVATLSRLCGDPEKYRRYYLNAFSQLAFMGLPLSIMLTLFGRDFILLLLGPQWGQAADIFSVLGIGISVQILYATYPWLHISQGRTDRWLRWNLVGTAVTIILFFVGLPFGAIGVAAAYTAALYILIMPALWYAGKPIGLTLSSVLSAVWRYYAAAVSTGLLCGLLLSLPMADFIRAMRIAPRLFVSSLICFVLYILFVILFHGNAGPIRRFLDVARDLLPSGRKRKVVQSGKVQA